MATRLRITRLDRVGFVGKGDDPEATIVFWKRAETFAEQGDEQQLRNELWDTAHAMSRALESALFDAEEDQDPEALILTSLEQFAATVKAKLPMWLQGKAVDKKAKGKKEAPVVLKSDEQRGQGLVALMKKMATALGWPKEEIEEIEKLGQEGSEGDPAKEGDMEGFDVTKLPDEAQAEFTKLQEEITGLKEQVAKAEPEGEKEPEKDPVSEEVQKRLDKADERAQKAEERVTKMELDRENERFLKLAGDYTLPSWTADDCGPMLRKIHGALDEDEVKKFTEVLKGASEAIKTGALLKAVGEGGEPEEGSAQAEVKAEVEKLMAADAELDEQTARGQVFRKNGPLQNRYTEERKAQTAGN